MPSKARMQKLQKERAAIAHSGHFHWAHWSVVILSIVLTIGAWHISRTQVQANADRQFEEASIRVLDLIEERMRKYEVGLWSGVSTIHATGGTISREQWRSFAEHLRIQEKYPGINGIGVIFHVLRKNAEQFLTQQRENFPDFRIFPDHTEQDLYPITYIEPQGPNIKAVGLDMAHEITRFTAAKKSGDTGTAQITGPIFLVQDDQHTPGFLFLTPFYDDRITSEQPAQNNNLIGLVYAPFVFHKLMEGVLDQNQRQVRIVVRDGSQALFDERSAGTSEPEFGSPFNVTMDLQMYGRTWTFDIWATQEFRDRLKNNQPAIILVGGIYIDFLLFALFFLLTRANRRAVDLADRMTAELKTETKALQTSNAELEKFAYVTSHDLKTPLRGIGDLTEYLEEDLEDYCRDPNANPDIARNIQRLHQQVSRMDGLINGILEYSSIGDTGLELKDIDLPVFIATLGDELGLDETQIVLKGPIEHLHTDAVRLQQVLSNLLGNAVKYHHALETILITITVLELPDSLKFTISDNGPGIDPRFHDRIFEAFQALQSHDEIESTGIGLSIVKKSVEAYGGRVTVRSELGQGTEFTFDWPKDINAYIKRKAA